MSQHEMFSIYHTDKQTGRALPDVSILTGGDTPLENTTVKHRHSLNVYINEKQTQTPKLESTERNSVKCPVL